MNNPFDHPSEPIDQRLAVGLAKISTALRHRSWREGYADDLTPTQGQVLLHLRHTASATLAEVADALAVRPPTASEAVRVLVAKGLVHKGRRPDDGRILDLSLTSQGRTKAERVADWPDFLSEVIGELSEIEQSVLMTTLQRAISRLQERGDIPMARMCSTCTYFRPNIHSDPDRPHHCAFVNAPFGVPELRFDCPDHQPADAGIAAQAWHHLAPVETAPGD